MTADPRTLVERLERQDWSSITGELGTVNPDGPEAAARIRQLEAALGWIAETNFGSGFASVQTRLENDLGLGICEIQRVARAALSPSDHPTAQGGA